MKIQPNMKANNLNKKEIKDYIGGKAYFSLRQQLKRKGMVPEDLTEREIYEWKLEYDRATAEMISMRRLYEEKSRS